MSPRNRVLSLSACCLKSISTQLTFLLSDDEGTHYAAVRRYLSDATHEVLQELLGIILSTENLDAATRFSCLQVLLRGDVKKLSTGIFPHSYYEKILEEIRESGVGLQHLNLKGVWVRDFPDLLSETIRKLKNLKALTIPHMADDGVLEAVIGCENLVALDISGECILTESALKTLKSEKITILDIGSYGKKDICNQDTNPFDILAEIIENLPNLNIIRTYSFTGKVLQKLYTKQPNFKTRLKYLHDTETSVEDAEAIVTLCPEMENIYIDTPTSGVLDILSRLKRMHSLKLSKFDWLELINFLEASGSKLQVLKLNNCKESVVDLSKICYLATNLQTLECFKLDLTFSQPESYFMNLQITEILYCNLGNFALRCLLMNSPFLKKIVVGDVVHMTDGDVFRLCAECDFVNLEELWFSCARCLTATSVELLMGHCPNLKIIGQLSGWSVTQADVDFFRAVILSNNLDLTLLPEGPLV